MIKDGVIIGKIAKEIFPEMIQTKVSPQKIVDQKGLKVMSDDGEIKKIVEKLISENPDVVEKYKNGNKKIRGFFVGETMKATKGQANPQVVNQLLDKALD